MKQLLLVLIDTHPVGTLFVVRIAYLHVSVVLDAFLSVSANRDRQQDSLVSDLQGLLLQYLVFNSLLSSQMLPPRHPKFLSKYL